MSTSKKAKEVATARLLQSLSANPSRRGLLKGAIAGAGIAVAGAGALSGLPAYARTIGAAGVDTAAQSVVSLKATGATVDSIVDILTVARTAEQLAVTFYSNGIAWETMASGASSQCKSLYSMVSRQL